MKFAFMKSPGLFSSVSSTTRVASSETPYLTYTAEIIYDYQLALINYVYFFYFSINTKVFVRAY